jgi:hypothetical protein
MKFIKLFEEWKECENDLNEAIPSKLMQDIALFGKGETETKKIEDEINKNLGDNAEVTIENKPISELSINNKKVENELKKDKSVDSVMLIKVKSSDSSIPSTFVIPQKKNNITFDKSGTASLPTIFIGKNDAININVGGLRTILNDVAKGKDFDIDRATAKISLKHTI